MDLAILDILVRIMPFRPLYPAVRRGDDGPEAIPSLSSSPDISEPGLGGSLFREADKPPIAWEGSAGLGSLDPAHGPTEGLPVPKNHPMADMSPPPLLSCGNIMSICRQRGVTDGRSLVHVEFNG